MPVHAHTFRISEQEQQELSQIVKAMQESSGLDLEPSDVWRMLIREEAYRRRAYGPALLGDVVCQRNQAGQAVVTGVSHDWVLSSPSGFEWGYYGQGPRDLALNILLKATADRHFAFRHHFRFCEEVVSRIPHSGGTVRPAEVLSWVPRFRDDDRARAAVSMRDGQTPDRTQVPA